jgi:glycosyltransferase involved in cell wall biosynthesis
MDGATFHSRDVSTVRNDPLSMTGLAIDSRMNTAAPVEGNGPRKRPVRVCILAPSIDVLGGQSRQAERLMIGLAPEPSVEIGFIPHAPRLPRPLRFLQRIKYVRTVVNTLVYWFMAATRLWRYDVIHAYSASYWSYLLSVLPIILLAKLYRKPLLLNYHSGEAEDHLANWKLTALPFIRLADLIVVPSGYLVDVFAKFGLRARAIHNVVELEVFRYRERKPIRPVFLTSRLHEPLYNVACVLRAFAIVQRSYPEASLVVAGDGWMRPQLEQLAKDLGLGNTRFVGRVPWGDMPDLYDASDVYLTATNIDNMPGSVIECLSCGLPVVTTNAGGVPYIVTHEETALIVPCDDHEAMAAQAMRLLRDDDLAVRLARNGRTACVRFAWPAVRDAWLEAYHELGARAARASETVSA